MLSSCRPDRILQQDKKKKKSAFDWGADPDPIVEVPPDPPAAAGNDQDDWLSAGFDTGKKSKKGESSESSRSS